MSWLRYIVILFFGLLTACASLPDNTDRVESHVFTDTRDTALARDVKAYREMGQEAGQEAGQESDGFLLLESGLDAFVARAVLAEMAERSLDVQYYLYHDDLVGKLFTGLLWKAAERGVRVRLLIDDMGMDGRDKELIMLDSHPNIELRIFNPFDRDIGRGVQFITGLGTVTRRMHNKSFTADNVMTIIGGRNIGNEYYDADPTLEFADLDVLVIGDVVSDVSNSFDAYWNSSLAYPVTTLISKRADTEDVQQMAGKVDAFMDEQMNSNYMTALLNSGLAEKIRDNDVTYYWGDASVVVDHPEKISSSRDANELHLVTQLAPYFENIRYELIIVAPYFVPGDEGVAFFKRLIDQGVRVKILTNSLASNDVGMTHAGYSNYRKALLRAGVELYEMNKKLTRAQRNEKKGVGGSSKASLHAKVFVLDRRQVFIGSLNLDPRSFYENSEIGVVLDSTEMAQEMASNFDADIAKNTFRLELKRDEDDYEYLLWHGYEAGRPVTFEVDPYSSIWRRLGVGFMSILPIESQL